MPEPSTTTAARIADAHRHLYAAENALESLTPQAATPRALTGLLTLALAACEQVEADDTYARLHSEADAAIGRVLELADELDAESRSALKPVAFTDLATRIREALG